MKQQEFVRADGRKAKQLTGQSHALLVIANNDGSWDLTATILATNTIHNRAGVPTELARKWWHRILQLENELAERLAA